ncbi:MAG: type II toxin-antitoxin system HicB family antitoxin [Phycisphaerae bacterium]|nr:type II toxin-antitoxin system HicB family antitoxin [Phycisphaerae bacterium]
MKHRIHIERDEDGKFAASCPAQPGCWSQGDRREQAVGNMGDAIRGYIESLRTHGDPAPPPISEEVIDVNIGRAPCAV